MCFCVYSLTSGIPMRPAWWSYAYCLPGVSFSLGRIVKELNSWLSSYLYRLSLQGIHLQDKLKIKELLAYFTDTAFCVPM